jgi:chorismate mutase/prephenate dehydratase
MSQDDMLELRDEITRVDRQILSLLKERMDIVERIAEAKLSQGFAFRDRAREERVLAGVREIAVENDLDAHEIERLYRLVMDISVARQQSYLQRRDDVPLRVAYQGIEGSNSHLTAQARYGGRSGGVQLMGYETVHEAAAAVTEGRVDVALLPVENTTAGSINETYDILVEGTLAITGEVIRKVHHSLLGLPGADLDRIETVLSHPQALAQCDRFIRGLPLARPRAAFDTAGAAAKVKRDNLPEQAAIASREAADLFGLVVLAENIQSESLNFTRFLEVARERIECAADATCKTSIVLTLRHEPGALGQILTELSSRSVNLTKLESRPIAGEPWRYRFYLDIEGHEAEERVSAAIEAIRPLAADLRIIGSYARAQDG